MRHRFMLPLGCLAKSGQSALAQQQAGAIDAAAMRAGFAEVAGNVTKTLHYGNIITYLRMMGMVPPSS